MQIEYVALIYFPLIPLFVLGTAACFVKNKNAFYVLLLFIEMVGFLEIFAVMEVSSVDEYNEVIVEMLKLQVAVLGIMMIWFMAMYFIVRPVIASAIGAFERRYSLRSS